MSGDVGTQPPQLPPVVTQIFCIAGVRVGRMEHSRDRVLPHLIVLETHLKDWEVPDQALLLVALTGMSVPGQDASQEAWQSPQRAKMVGPV